jgi:CDP-glucose 4,6-dehydratase
MVEMLDNLKKFWGSKKIVITGHTGFKGSWLSLFLKHLDAEIHGISREEKDGIYKLGNLKHIFESEVFLDISDSDSKILYETISKINPDIVFHFAAQSLVIEGYKNPRDTIYSNIIGTFNILEVVSKVDTVKSLIISTTDKVYKFSHLDNTENSELGGKGFYSASKVAVENIIIAFNNSFISNNLKVSTVRSGNVIGGGDRASNRLLTDLTNSVITNQDFTLRMPNSIRPWQYVLDSIFGYLLIAEDNFTNNISDTFNLNSKINNKFTSQYLTERFIEIWGSEIKIITDGNQKYKEVDVLKINSKKAKDKLGWEPLYDIPETINNIVNWEKAHLSANSNNPEFSLRQVDDYIKKLTI